MMMISGYDVFLVKLMEKLCIFEGEDSRCVFWTLTPRNLVDDQKHFGEVYCLHLQAKDALRIS
jgi:hypothetical protein